MGTPTACDDLEKIWSDVATNHMRRKVGKKSYLQLREVILEVMTEAFSLDPTQQQAWANLVKYILFITEIQDVYKFFYHRLITST